MYGPSKQANPCLEVGEGLSVGKLNKPAFIKTTGDVPASSAASGMSARL
jgi:hypothetical protein